jgi:tetratricopeptide (TPR) repeat protein
MSARISLSMIVKNEERALPKCLAAARPWVDEVVVVDTGSTDRTPDIAREFGAIVHAWAWRDDFAAARNESLRHCTGDWVLALDADEVMTPESGPALRRACDEAPADVVAYDIKIVCPREGDGGLVRLNWFPRLFRRLPGVQWEGVIHEQVTASVAEHGRTERSQIEVLHSGYTLDPATMAAKAERNLELLGRQLQTEPDYAPGWFQLAETYALVGKLDEAIDAYRRCLRLIQLSRLTFGSGVVALALQNLGAVLVQRGRPGDKEEGIRLIRAAMEVDGSLATPHVHLGNHAMADHDWEAAERHFGKALEMVERQHDNDQFQICPWLIHTLRGCARAQQRRLPEAIASFEASVALNPEYKDALWLLALAASDHGDHAKSLSALDRLAGLGRDDFPFHVRRASVLAALGRHGDAADAARAALRHEPDSAPIQLVLAENLARDGRPAEAAQAYERLTASSPDNPAPWLAMAQCWEAAGERDKMMAAYRRAVELAPESPDVLFALGSACLRGGALDTAEACLAAAIAARPERPEFRFNHVLCLVKKGDLEGARRALASIVERWPSLTQAGELVRAIDRFGVAAVDTEPARSAS